MFFTPPKSLVTLACPWYTDNEIKVCRGNSVIRRFNDSDLNSIMHIWLDTNSKAHSFISRDYWEKNYDFVRQCIPAAEVFVYETDVSKQIEGFIGVDNNYVSGIFVNEHFQSRGIGKQLLNYVKQLKPYLVLSVYQKNKRAVQFYQREGFVIQSEGTDKDTSEKEFTMTWRKKF